MNVPNSYTLEASSHFKYIFTCRLTYLLSNGGNVRINGDKFGNEVDLSNKLIFFFLYLKLKVRSI